MRSFMRRIEALVWWLRRPERFIHKVRAFREEHPSTPRRDLDHVAHQLGINVLDADLGPHIYGATTHDLGQPMIVLHPRLDPWHREFTFAHELGHAQLHLPEMAGTEALSPPTTRDFKDVEADAFAFVSLLEPVPKEDLWPTAAKYVRTNHDMLHRSWRIAQYFLFYNLRIWIANGLERMFLNHTTRGAR